MSADSRRAVGIYSHIPLKYSAGTVGNKEQLLNKEAAPGDIC